MPVAPRPPRMPHRSRSATLRMGPTGFHHANCSQDEPGEAEVGFTRAASEQRTSRRLLPRRDPRAISIPAAATARSGPSGRPLAKVIAAFFQRSRELAGSSVATRLQQSLERGPVSPSGVLAQRKCWSPSSRCSPKTMASSTGCRKWIPTARTWTPPSSGSSEWHESAPTTSSRPPRPKEQLKV